MLCVAYCAIYPRTTFQHPGDDGLKIMTAITLDPSTPSLGSPMELRCSSSLSQAQWTNSITSRGSKLTWNEAGTARERDVIYNNRRGEAVLRISNFTIADYGVYTCLCVNNFTFVQYEMCGTSQGLPTHCSAPNKVDLLPSTGMHIHTQREYGDECALEIL